LLPLIDNRPEDSAVREETLEGWAHVISSGRYVLGEYVARFEDAFARFCGVRHCVAVGSGTDAIELALRAAGVRRGDRVVVPALTFVASAFAVVRAGAKPVFVDVTEAGLANAHQIVQRVVDGARAVLPVDLYGQVCPLEDVGELCGRAIVIEDAAHAHGASRRGVRAGAVGDIAAFSFHPSKNLGAFGDAGAVVTDSDDVMRELRLLRSHGGETPGVFTRVGFNSRMDEAQAVVLNAKLPHLQRWNRARRRAARLYDELLRSVEDARPLPVVPGNVHVYHLYVVRIPRRDAVVARLRAQGIMAGVHYATPLPHERVMRSHERRRFPVAESLAMETLSLPLFPSITEDDQVRVVDTLKRALLETRASREPEDVPGRSLARLAGGDHG